jgi:DnaK suppressor protein
MAMKKKDLNTFKVLLEDEKRKILRHLEELSEESEVDLESGSGDSVDIASMEITQANLQKIGKREAYLLKKIDLALSKIEDGSYGVCENCGEDIGVPRLTARPVAQLCIDCKTEQESVERRYSSRQEEEEEDDGVYDEGEDF